MKALVHLVLLLTLAMFSFSFGCSSGETGGTDTSGEAAAPNPDNPAEHAQETPGSGTEAPAQ